MGAGEELTQGSDTGLEALDADVERRMDDVEGAAAGGREGQAGGEAAPELPPEIAAAVERQVTAAVQLREKELREEYEGKGGHLSKLRSKLDRQIAELRHQLDARQAQEWQAAVEQIEEDPHTAAQRLAALGAGYQQQRVQTAQQVEIEKWAGDVLEQLGLDPDDDEVVAKAAQVGPLTAPNATYTFLGEMSTLALERERAARTKAEKDLATTVEGLPALVRQQVAQAVAASGLGAVDAGEGGGAVGPNRIKDITDPGKLIRMGMASAAKKGRRG